MSYAARLRFRTLTPALVFAGAILNIALVLGCDEPKKPIDTKSKSVPDVSPKPPEPIPEPSTKEEPKKIERAWPKLTDCPKGPPKLPVQSAELEGAIRVKAQKPDGDLTSADLRRLRSLNLSRVPAEGIDICLFAHMPELRELTFGPDQIGDLEPIAKLGKLESLSMTRNPILDLSPLKKLVKLDRITIANAQITDLSPLEGLRVLTEVNFDDNPVEDISVLANMKELERVSLQRTKVSSAVPLSKLKKLRFLYLTGSPLGDDIGATAELVRNGTKVIRE